MTDVEARLDRFERSLEQFHIVFGHLLAGITNAVEDALQESDDLVSAQPIADDLVAATRSNSSCPTELGQQMISVRRDDLEIILDFVDNMSFADTPIRFQYNLFRRLLEGPAREG